VVKSEDINVIAAVIIIIIIVIGLCAPMTYLIWQGCPAGEILVKKALYGLACVKAG
jgi:flagellar basal body-associated protein FliL